MVCALIATSTRLAKCRPNATDPMMPSSPSVPPGGRRVDGVTGPLEVEVS